MPRSFDSAVDPVEGSRDLKHRISLAGIEWLAGELAAVGPGFPRKRFTDTAQAGLAQMALKQRVDHVAAALDACMPSDFAAAASVLDGCLASPSFEGWMLYPVNAYIAQAGIEHPKLALPLLARTTGRWTAEYAVRPFIEHHFDLTYSYLDEWADHPDLHVRRLVSEGTRPRLPWGAQLRALIADPRPSIALLDRLVDDPSEYVRRSVANHLNDISKDHPQLAIATAERWLNADRRPSAEVDQDLRLAIVRHGLRSQIKRGDPSALALLGFDPAADIDVSSFIVTPGEIAIGGQVRLDLTLTASQATPALVDYRVHFQGAKGVRAPKVFKWTTRTLEPGSPLLLSRRHRFQHASIRRLFPGEHRLEVQVNGRVRAAATIALAV